MTTLASEPFLDPVLLDRQWWFVRLYTRGFDGADPLISDLLPPLMAEARAQGIDRWFFIRYLDEHGPHIRLRVLGDRAVLDHLQQVHAELRPQLRDALAAHPARHEFIAALPRPAYEQRRGAGARPALYEPEEAKYGGPRGIELAEELFQFSSDLAVWACGRLAKTTARAGLATLLLADAADALLNGPTTTATRQRVDWDGYWDRHLRWWTADLRRQGPATGDHLLAGISREPDNAQTFPSRVEERADVAAWRRRWARALDTYLDRACHAEVNRTPQHLTFHQAHMMLNRLGFLPREEAILGARARLRRPARS